MSKGHGARERHVLTYLRHYAALMRDLGAWDEAAAWVPVRALVGEDATRSDVEAARRACKSLAGEGLIDLHRRDDLNGAPLAARLCVDGDVGRSSGQRLWRFLPASAISVDPLTDGQRL